MRQVYCFIALLVIGSTGAPTFGDDAKDIVERAVKACCDKPELLLKQKRQIINMKGKIWQNGQSYDAIRETKADWPGSLQWDISVELPEVRLHKVLCFAGDQSWELYAGMAPKEMDIIRTDEMGTEVYGRWLSTLYPLRDGEISLAALKDAKVGDENVAVVKASLRLRPDVFLSFSKANGQLLKIAYKAHEGGNEFRKEHFFSDYRTFESLSLPTKMIDRKQSGTANEKLAEWTVTDYKFVDKFEAGTFQMPSKK